MRKYWRKINRLKELVESINMDEFHELATFFEILHRTTMATELQHIPIASYYYPLVIGLLTRFGLNVKEQGINTTYESIYDKDSKRIKLIHRYTNESCAFVINGQPIKVSEMSKFGQTLFENICCHLAFRLLPRKKQQKLPDLYMMCSLVNPFTKIYMEGIVGMNYSSNFAKNLLEKAFAIFLPDFSLNEQQAKLSSSAPAIVQQPVFMATKHSKTFIEKFIEYEPDQKQNWINDATLDGILNDIYNIDVLQYWKDTTLFPQVKLLNMILMSTEVTSSTCERYFSMLKDSIGPRRQLLSIEKLSKYVCCRYLKVLENKEIKENKRKEKQEKNQKGTIKPSKENE